MDVIEECSCQPYLCYRADYYESYTESKNTLGTNEKVHLYTISNFFFHITHRYSIERLFLWFIPRNITCTLKVDQCRTMHGRMSWSSQSKHLSTVSSIAISIYIIMLL